MGSQAKPKVLLNREEIAATVSRLAAEINNDYRDKYPILIGVLKGAFVFMADLIRCLEFSPEVDFIRVSSYGRERESSGRIKMVHDLCSSIKGRDVLVIEDIVDTGRTQAFLLGYLRKKEPASLRLCALTDKPARREVPVKIDYLGRSIPNKFIVGYGIDWDEKFRNLPDICFLEDEG